MNIELKLSKDFERCLEELKEKYGEDFEYINGLHPSQLDFSEFIENFVDKDTLADASIDPNANANHKDIRSFMTEKGKSEDKLFGLNKIFTEIKKMWGLRTAKQWLEAEFSRAFYLNDSTTASYFPYCFSGDTKILTKQGIKRLDELVGQDILVLNKNHGWEHATVKCFGKANVRKLTLDRRGTRKEIYVTGNHRWFVREKDRLVIKETDELTSGMCIPLNTTKSWSSINPSPFGVAHGFYMGDGAKGKHPCANFCGDKKALIPYFTPANVYGTEKELSVGGIPNYFAKLPDINESSSYLYGWLMGYFAADGCVDKIGRCTISSTNLDNMNFIRDVLCVLGMPTSEIRYQDRISNLTGEMGRVYTISISPEFLTKDFFLRPTHKEKFREPTVRKHLNWHVVSVEQTNLETDVYCAVTDTTHSFTLEGNVLTHNCWANDFTRLAKEGLFFLHNYNNQPPQHLTTYFDDVIEFISFLSNRQSGAVGAPNVLIWAWYFWKKDVEEGYYMKDPDYYLRQQFQKFIYRLNQPFLRIDQSAFTNVSIFDHPYLESLFGGVEFPDGTLAIDHIEDFIECQKVFMEVVSETRETNMFTYPVLTYSLLYKDGKFQDEPFARWCSNHNIKWSDANFFVSDNVGILSNCPMSADTEILYWSERRKEFESDRIGALYSKIETRGKENNIQVISNGKKIHCRINHFDESAEYEIKLVNGAVIKTTANHLNKVYGKDYVASKDLTTDDYLPVSLTPFEETKDMSYEDGYLVGMFLGDGSYSGDNAIVFSLNYESKKDCIDFVERYCADRFHANISYCDCVSDFSGKPSCVNVRVSSKYLQGLIKQFVCGNDALTKGISYRAISCSLEFRRGIVDGLYATDGGNSNRIYTSSENLKDSLVTMLATMGIASTVTVDEREGRLGTKPCYTVRYYTPEGRTRRENVYIIDDKYFWFKIKEINKISGKQTSYCLEVLDDTEPVFMLANGIVTHNCRLLSDTKKLDAFINSIGGTALSVGSCRVSTINLVRIAYESGFNKKKYIKILRDRVLLDCKALTAMRHIIKRNIEKGLLPNYQDGAVELDKQFCTIGAIGNFEVMDLFGLINTDEIGCKSYSDEAVEFTTEILDTINEVKDNFECDFTFNLEMIPAENCAGVICQADNLLYEQNKYFIYSNQWIPLMEKCTLQEKCRLGSLFDKKCGGGCIAHIDIENRFPNEETAWDMLNYVASQGVIYFAFTTKISVCEHKHAFIGEQRCPICGEPIADTYSRVVGFYTPVSSYQKIRKQEFDKRKWMNVLQNDEVIG